MKPNDMSILMKQILSARLPYHHLLASFSFITLSCGLLNVIGHEPYTFHLIIAGSVGLFLSFITSIYYFIKI